jgi:hypothetical protein
MAMIQSSTPIEVAARNQTRLFIVYVVVLAIGGIAATLLTVLVYRAGNAYQGAVKADADARIAEAGTKAAEANAQAAKANEGLGKSNEEIARLTAEAEQAKAERAEADRQIAIAKADAARAKEGIANAEAVSAKASVEVARLQIVVSNAEQKRAEAEKALLELQERIKDRHLTAIQRKSLLDGLAGRPNGQLEVRCPIGSPEIRNFAVEFAQVFAESGWKVTLNDSVIINPAPTGYRLWTHTSQTFRAGQQITDDVPDRFESIRNAFRNSGLPLEVQFSNEVPAGELILIIGFKP